ncbi:hypothetical protein Fcan01_15539 [Folsomia candida]|uniref:Uncharacterized protein n=1 Tax=Folsomia candida TaxID=158441 RepID=A0A226DX77_FOLCA|nr:hypothetical protein Fcan01_15539 [Folsomia candida]
MAPLLAKRVTRLCQQLDILQEFIQLKFGEEYKDFEKLKLGDIHSEKVVSVETVFPCAAPPNPSTVSSIFETDDTHPSIRTVHPPLNMGPDDPVTIKKIIPLSTPILRFTSVTTTGLLNIPTDSDPWVGPTFTNVHSHFARGIICDRTIAHPNSTNSKRTMLLGSNETPPFSNRDGEINHADINVIHAADSIDEEVDIIREDGTDPLVDQGINLPGTKLRQVSDAALVIESNKDCAENFIHSDKTKVQRTCIIQPLTPDTSNEIKLIRSSKPSQSKSYRRPWPF